MTNRLAEVKEQPRSVSQALQYEKCPYAYYLGRVELDDRGDRIWDRPAAWLPMGTAVHAAAEAYERSGRTMTVDAAQAVYRDSYVSETNELLSTSTMDYWFASGPYGGEADIERRFGIGLAQTEKYVDYYSATGKGSKDVVWVADNGTPGIELGFEVDLDGVKVRGFIDTVFTEVVNDNKTGAHPGDEFQLKTYRIALQEQYDLTIDYGQFWMGRTGKPTKPVDLSGTSRSEISDAYHRMDENVKAERFDPKPDPEKCGRCGFNSYCPFVAM